MQYYGNLPAHKRGTVFEGSDKGERAEEAMKTLRQLGARMLSFAATETAAMRLIRWRRYRPKDAGNSLIGYSNTIMTTDGERAVHRANILDALRIEE
jgi:hypothetical protein